MQEPHDLMTIWITGCAGFLGSRLAPTLRAQGHYVVSLSRRPCPAADRSISIDLASEKACHQLERLGQECGYPEVVVHAASRQPGRYQLSEYIRSNVLTTAHLLDALVSRPPRQLIYTSTQRIYGRTDLVPVKETHPARGEEPYAITKWWSEQLLRTVEGPTQTIILRLPSLFGAGQADSFIDGLARLALQNQAIELFARGQLIRDALHVDDVIEAIAACVVSPPSDTFCCLNLGCGQPVTTRQYAEALIEALGSRSPIVPIDRQTPQPMDLYADIEEAQRQIGFYPTGLRVAMQRYAEELRVEQGRENGR
ncbi:MAG: NAD(P)-dependent oxidoreductase [Candidatus Omnitrophota bacterium]|nr:NAD(P)-dependent oxidoreductase [Candidatus Omnitrophota bacterium]